MVQLTHLSFGTKTPYVPPSPIEPLRSYTPYHDHSRTKLIHVSIIARHGTRNPTRNSINRMLQLESWLRTALPSQPAWLDRWATSLAAYSQSPGDLTVEGEQELWHIGRRFAKNYAQSLHTAGGALRVRSSYKTRAVASARAFLDGYLQTCAIENLPLPTALHQPDPESDSDSDPETRSLAQDSSSISSADDDPVVQVLPIGRDDILRFFEQHAEYASFTIKHKARMRRELVSGPLSKFTGDVARRISKALGAVSPMDLSLVRVVGEACSFDYAHGRANTSVFCRMLGPEDTALLEMLEKRHRPFFKAHEHFRTVAAPLVADLVGSLTSCVGDTPNLPRFAADLRFAHAETLVPLLLLLGIRTNGLSPDDPDYRRGLNAMSPFAANLAVELYEHSAPEGKSFFVRFRLHERYVEKIPALGEHGRDGVVRLEHLLRFFEDVLKEGMPYYS